MRILLATLNTALRNAVRAALESAGHVVETIPAGDDDDGVFDASAAELIIMDDAFPRQADREDLDLLVAQMMHARLLCLRTPTLTAGHDSPDVAHDGHDEATEAGVLSQIDDELYKPFSDAELLAHVRRLSRVDDAEDTTILTRGDLALDTDSRRAFYGDLGRPLPLSPREYAALEMLVRADGGYLTFDELLEGVCGNGFFEQRDIMATAMRSLARKLQRAGLFLTQRGDRYRIG
ncbi:response regulator transcription factor [Bifidobacterium callimiconis]|uniref:Transcriptional regulator n=1 Tax=Bifidobacterium callimiconis TaxID=2306973 RepID=A0A430FI27_9BIFI|nr:response regulator transcription factor [Bifidobacterium callimiconis]MBT1176380.1 response regulator transcription factor [Bifidobacterium callimiconis]RSX52496.1 transcriptional regulator [Bifidobacterium callimiconis]